MTPKIEVMWILWAEILEQLCLHTSTDSLQNILYPRCFIIAECDSVILLIWVSTRTTTTTLGNTIWLYYMATGPLYMLQI